MKCRLLYVVGQLRAGGLERQLYYLLQSIDRERYGPAVAVWNFSPQEVYVRQIAALGVPLYDLPTACSSAMKLVAFRRLVKKLRPEVVHSYTFFTNIVAWWGALGTETLAVGSVRSDFAWAKRDTGFYLGKLSARWPGNQIFNNYAAAERARSSYGLFAPKGCFTVPNGLDFCYFEHVPISSAEPAVIVGLGSLFHIKRWDRLLRAAAELKQRNFNFELRIVGDGPLKDDLQCLARRLNLESYVKLTGYVEDVAAVLREATFVVHTSDSEGCPNVVLEAMASGRPVVATEVGDVPSLVEHGKTGYVVACDNHGALVERMADLIKDRDLCRRMGQAGRAKAEREFDLDRLVTRTFEIYRSIGWRG